MQTAPNFALGRAVTSVVMLFGCCSTALHNSLDQSLHSP